MATLFNYSTLNVTINKETKNITIELCRPERGNAIDSEMIFELESLFAWLTQHIEVQSIFLTGAGKGFSSGLYGKHLKKMSDKKFELMLTRLQKLSYSLFFLPQTIIVDFKSEARGVAIEISSGADIRLAKEGAIIQMDHINHAFIPTCGGIGFLSETLPKNFVRQWVLSGIPIPQEALLQSGLVQRFYKAEVPIQEYLETIAIQAPIARIQAKRALLESVFPELNRTLEYERQTGFAGMYLGDWRKHIEAIEENKIPEYTSPKILIEILRRYREGEGRLEN